jgi:hypothetical protein
VSVSPKDKSAFESFLKEQSVAFSQLGSVKGSDFVADGQVVSSVEKASGSYFTALEKALV